MNQVMKQAIKTRTRSRLLQALGCPEGTPLVGICLQQLHVYEDEIEYWKGTITQELSDSIVISYDDGRRRIVYSWFILRDMLRDDLFYPMT